MSDPKNKQKQHGYWQIRVYYDNQQTSARGWQVAGKDDAHEQYEAAIQQAMRDPAHALWRVELVYCVVTETVYERDGTMY